MVKYENSPPPSDLEYEDIPVFFAFPRPQYHPHPKFITIDYSLIHPSLLGIKSEDKSENEIETGQEASKDENKNLEKVDHLNDKVVERNSTDNEKKTKSKCAISQKDQCNLVFEEEKKEKQKLKSKRKKKIESRISKNETSIVAKTSALHYISELYSGSSHSESDSGSSEKELSLHKEKYHSKKSSSCKKKDKYSINKTSYSSDVPYEKVGLRSAKVSAKQEFSSSDEESIIPTISAKNDIPIKGEVLSDKDNFEKYEKKSEKKKFKKRKKSKDTNDHPQDEDLDKFPKDKDWDNSSIGRYDEDSSGSRHDEDNFRRIYDDKNSRSRHEDNFKHKYDTCKFRNDDNTSINNFDDDCLIDSYNNIRKEDYDSDCHKDISDYHCGRFDSRKKYRNEYSSEGDSNSRSLNPRSKAEEHVTYYGPNDYYCGVCKVTLNSESTHKSHMAGKKHKKALRQFSEQEVARSTVLEITESQSFSRAPDMDRLELHDEISRIQKTCDDAKLLILGLDDVQEIRGYDETKYYCDLCDAQCVANSIIKHLMGFKHQMFCLKQYFPRSYSWVKELDKKDWRVVRELKTRLEEAQLIHGKGKIKVLKDVRKNPMPYNPYQPSTSRQSQYVPVKKEVQDKKPNETKVTDEDCLSRDFSDFYCKVCDSHMNNLSMWESHAMGKRHAKNKKKAPEGLVTNSNFIEAPRGTISHLEKIIEEECHPEDVIVGLNFVRENQGENGDLYNCYLCGSVCPTIDIIDHLYLMKHKSKYLEKMLADGHQNAISSINDLHVSDSAKAGLIDEECAMMMDKLGRGKPVIGITKKNF